MFGSLSRMTTVVIVAALTAGCMTGIVIPGDGALTGVDEVAAKASDVAAHVGGADGFGGSLMNGYVDHMPDHMGFGGVEDLAPEESSMMVMLRNEADHAGTFHLNYMASHMGLDEQSMDVVVGAGDVVVVDIPCSEIVGVGPLDMPGAPGCHVNDGVAVDNLMSVPGFLGQDFRCGETYACVLTQDVDDLDEDGDTAELIILSDAMALHMTEGGPGGHRHGSGFGMMGHHMGL